MSWFCLLPRDEDGRSPSAVNQPQNSPWEVTLLWSPWPAPLGAPFAGELLGAGRF